MITIHNEDQLDGFWREVEGLEIQLGDTITLSQNNEGSIGITYPLYSDRLQPGKTNTVYIDRAGNSD